MGEGTQGEPLVTAVSDAVADELAARLRGTDLTVERASEGAAHGGELSDERGRDAHGEEPSDEGGTERTASEDVDCLVVRDDEHPTIDDPSTAVCRVVDDVHGADPIGGADDWIERDLALARPDLLERRIRTTVENRRRERAIERKERRLEEFASVVSHDLRNPISVARGRIELAREADDPEAAADHLAAVDRAVDRMDRIVEDVLSLVRDGNADLDLEPVALDEVTRRAWSNVDTDGATLQHVPDQTVLADEHLLTQAFENLFRNAVEHGTDEPPAQAREVTVDSGSAPSAGGAHEPTAGGADGGVTVRVGAVGPNIYVEDDGPGVPEEDRDEVFDPGFTTDREGTGLGLAIVDRIVRSHGWSIDVEEGAEGGARFRISGVEPPES